MSSPWFRHPAWLMLGICFADLFVSYSIRLGYGVALPEMIRDLGLTRTGAGSIYNAYLIAYLAGSPVAGYLGDRLGARRLMGVCALLLGLGVALLGRSTGLASAAAAFALAGLGATGMWAPLVAVVQRWFAPQRRGLTLGILSTGYGLGMAGVGVGFPLVAADLGWRWGWYLLGGAALALALVNGLALVSRPEDAGRRPWGEGLPLPGTAPAAEAAAGLGAVFRDPNFWLIGGAYAAVSFALYGFTTFMVDFARHGLGLPLAAAGRLATVHGSFQVAGVLTLLPLSDRLGRRATILIANGLIAACLAAVAGFGHDARTLTALVAVLAMFYGATFPVYSACAGDYFPRSLMGTVVGAWAPFFGVGAMATHWVTGLLRDATGGYTAAFALHAAAAALSVGLMLGVRRPGSA